MGEAMNMPGNTGINGVELPCAGIPGYSEFFRNSLTFAVLERIVLPSLVLKKKNSGRKEIRIWSAACAGGQEAYSVAILLEELKNQGGENPACRIFATDISETRIEEAREGLFSSESLNNVGLKRLNSCFIRQGPRYIVRPELKKYIDFSVFDLLGDPICPSASIFGDFDIIFCCNLLIYYKPEPRKTILDKIAGTLAAGGYIVTDETEREILIGNGCREIVPHAGIFK